MDPLLVEPYLIELPCVTAQEVSRCRPAADILMRRVPVRAAEEEWVLRSALSSACVLRPWRDPCGSPIFALSNPASNLSVSSPISRIPEPADRLLVQPHLVEMPGVVAKEVARSHRLRLRRGGTPLDHHLPVERRHGHVRLRQRGPARFRHRFPHQGDVLHLRQRRSAGEHDAWQRADQRPDLRQRRSRLRTGCP